LGSAAADADAEIEADTVALTEADIDDDIVLMNSVRDRQRWVGYRQ